MEKKGSILDHSSESDSDSSLPDLECETCGVCFTSVKSYESHMQSKKHGKKVAQEKFLAKQMMTNKTRKGKDNEGDNNDDEEKEDENELHCEVCDKYFTGHVSFMAHLKGSVHAKHLKKQKLKERVKDMPEVLDKESKGNAVDEDEDDDGIIQKPFARCSTCQKEFSGVESFTMHLKSNVHKKKVEHAKKIDTLKAKYQDEMKLSDGEEDLPKCDICDKSFSGPIPFHIHMKSSAHKKNVEKRKIAEEMKEFYCKDEPEPGYVCKECKKTFGDPVAFKHHLTNNSHEKQKAKDALKEFLNAFPEIVFVTSFDDKNAAPENDSDDSDQDYYLICKICHASFSGPESAKDHVKSKKHISLKKEKQLQKILKKQRKQTDDSKELNGAKDSVNSSGKIPKSVLKNGDSSSGKVAFSDKVMNVDDFELI